VVPRRRGSETITGDRGGRALTPEPSNAYRISMSYKSTARAEALTSPSLRVRVRSMEKRTIPEPVVRSPRWAAIEAAVEKVMARKTMARKVVSEKKNDALPRRNR
jgi:hypothetical protein